MKTKHTVWAACAASLIAFGTATSAFAAPPEGLQGVAAAERYRGAPQAVAPVQTPATTDRSASAREAAGSNVESQLRFRGDNTESQLRFRGDNIDAQLRAGI